MKILKYLENKIIKKVSLIGGVLFISLSFIPTAGNTALLESEKESITASCSTVLKDIAQINKEISELNVKETNNKGWFSLSEEEKNSMIEENNQLEKDIATEKDRIAEESRLAAEARAEAERIAAEEAIRKAYDTGITYEQLSRYPDQCKGQKLTIKGKILQISTGGLFSSNVLRVAVGGSYSKIAYITYPSSAIKSDGNILEDDYITIKGVSQGDTSYTTVLGAKVTLPHIKADEIVRN